MKNMRTLILFILLVYLAHVIIGDENQTSLACREWNKSHIRLANDFTYTKFHLVYVKFETMTQLNITCGILFNQKINMLVLQSANKNLLLNSNSDIGHVAKGEMHDVNHEIKLKEKVKKMIITNGMLFFVSLIPEFAMTQAILVLGKQLGDSCMNDMSCIELIEITHTFNFLSMGFQIFIFRYFDRNFRHSLDNIFKKN